MMLCVSWEEAAEAFGRPDPRDWRTGAQLYEIEAASLTLGVPLKRLSREDYNPETRAGLVSIGSPDGWHVAVLWHGLLFETDGSVWRVEHYLSASGPDEACLGPLLVWDHRPEAVLPR